MRARFSEGLCCFPIYIYEEVSMCVCGPCLAVTSGYFSFYTVEEQDKLGLNPFALDSELN